LIGELQTPKPQIAIVKEQHTSLRQSVQLLEPFTFAPDKAISFRIYPDNRPKNMEIANLQKGLVLVTDGTELIEEGAGFGVPIAKYSGTTFFSRSANVFLKQQGDNDAVITKVFLLDSISRKQVHGAFINDNAYAMIHKTFERAYLHRENMRPFFDWVMRLRKTLGIETHFTKVTPKGKVVVTYHCYFDHIKVHVDFSAMELTGCQEILILNEQGATFFREHRNNKGIVLNDQKIGAWTRVDAEQAEFSDIKRQVAFSMKKRKEAVLYCGWEQVKDRFSWAGMTYALNPKMAHFSYEIKISRG